jgi:hypothetical protein
MQCVCVLLVTDQSALTGWKGNNIDEPIHFVDMKPIQPSTPLSDELKYGTMLAGWTYTALISKKVSYIVDIIWVNVHNLAQVQIGAVG